MLCGIQIRQGCILSSGIGTLVSRQLSGMPRDVEADVSNISEDQPWTLDMEHLLVKRGLLLTLLHCFFGVMMTFAGFVIASTNNFNHNTWALMVWGIITVIGQGTLDFAARFGYRGLYSAPLFSIPPSTLLANILFL